LRGHPDDPGALVRLGFLARNAGDRSEAESLLRRAVQVAPDSEPGWIELSRTVADDREASAALEGFLRVKPDSAVATAELARLSLRSGDIGGAERLSEKAVKVAPDSADAWHARGAVMAALRRLPEAEKDYRRALSFRDDTETRLDLARLLIPLQRYAEIIALCSRAAQPDRPPDVSLEQHARALVYTAGAKLYESLSSADVQRLQAQLIEADSLSSKLPAEERFLPAYFLGESYLRLHRPTEAIPYLQRSAAAAPMFAGSLFSLARAYRLSGDVAKADAATARHSRLVRITGRLEAYGDRLEQRPDDAATLLRLADALADAGSVDDAARIYRRLIAAGTFAEEARRKLAALPAAH
jgi:tetratricopeptide (TPR) repeat protein